jgi:hypothetical protein
MAWLLASNNARSVEQAAGLVVATLQGGHSVRAAAERLARKFRNKISTKIGDELKQRREPNEPVIENPSKESAC